VSSATFPAPPWQTFTCPSMPQMSIPLTQDLHSPFPTALQHHQQVPWDTCIMLMLFRGLVLQYKNFRRQNWTKSVSTELGAEHGINV
jgi:hypothetical protein